MPRRGKEEIIYDIHNYNISYDTREVYIHGHYRDGEDEVGINFRVATTFIKNMNFLNQSANTNVLIHMHTVGGSWFDGMAMYNVIRLSRSPITILAYAEATSMSAILFQSGDIRVIMPDCCFMVHYGSISIDENSLAAEAFIKKNNEANRRMLNILVDRAEKGPYFKSRKMSREKIASFIDKQIRQTSDWYLTPEEVVDFGLADGIFGETGYQSIEEIRQW